MDRRETDAAYLAQMGALDGHLINERYIVPFLPVNPEMSATRNQSRQKLAKFNARDFASLIIDVLTEAKRRYLTYTGQLADEKTDAVTSTENAQTATTDLIAQGIIKDTAQTTENQQTKEAKTNGSTEPSKLIEDYDEVPSGEATKTSRNSASNTTATHSNNSAAMEDPTLLTFDDYLELKEQLAAADDKITSLSENNQIILSTLKSLETAVSHLVDENSQLRMQIKQVMFVGNCSDFSGSSTPQPSKFKTLFV